MNLWTSRWTAEVQRRDNGIKYVNKQILRLAILGTLIGTALPLYAQEGFYGGVSLRQGGVTVGIGA